MSAYLYLPLEVNAMVCTICGTESFAWLAEIFVCPVCGEFKFAFPMFVGTNDTDWAEEKKDMIGTKKMHDGGKSVGGQGKKRKRSSSDDRNA